MGFHDNWFFKRTVGVWDQNCYLCQNCFSNPDRTSGDELVDAQRRLLLRELRDRAKICWRCQDTEAWCQDTEELFPAPGYDHFWLARNDAGYPVWQCKLCTEIRKAIEEGELFGEYSHHAQYKCADGCGVVLPIVLQPALESLHKV